jgi:hypothetical protein
MPNPQQPEIGRSRKTPGQDPDSAATVIEGTPRLTDDGGGGPVPPDNQPGHHPPEEQDKPDLDAFAERLGTAAGSSGPEPSAETAGTADASARRRAVDRSTVRRAAAALVAVVAALLLGRKVRRRVVTA